ncbi:MAG: c-type cytochrome biogenesis protein CcmI [Rhodospirillaceae bacterium]
MTLFALLAAMAALAIAVVAVPLLRAGRRAPSRAAHELEIYRDQLDEVGRDIGRGLITPEQAEAARTEIGRRILALDGAAGGRGEAADTPRRAPAIALMAAVAVTVLAGAVYIAEGSPGLPGRPAAEARAERDSQPGESDLRRQVSELARALEAEPSDLPRWIALGDTLTGLREHAKAAVAYRQAARLAPDNADVVSREAEALTFAAEGQVTPEARSRFEDALDRNPGEPRALFYLGLADRQAGRLREALDRWLALEAASPPDAPWMAFLGPRIAQLALELGIDRGGLTDMRAQTEAPSAQSPGPTREQIEAAEEMSAEDRSAMIRSMVDRLAARLEENPDDPEGWMRLGRARSVLGESDAAKQAHAQAAALRPADTAVLAAWADSIVAAAEPGPPDRAELKPVIDRILARDDRHPRALWLAGALALSADEPAAARRHWTLLLETLDPNGIQYVELKRQIDALPEK